MVEARDFHSVWLDLGEATVKKEERLRVETLLSREYGVPASNIIDLQVDTQFSQINKELIYVPIYCGSYTYQNSVYLWVMDGRTGETRGERPYGLGVVGRVGQSIYSSIFSRK